MAAGRRSSYDLCLGEADYPPSDAAPRTSLLICTQQRSGSTLLGEGIYFAGTLGCPLEYFCGGFRPAFETRWATSDLPSYVAALHRHRTDASGVFSVKLFWSDIIDLAQQLDPTSDGWLPTMVAAQADAESYRRVLTIVAEVFPRPTFVFLSRQDEIRQAVSSSVAGQTGSWRRLSTQSATAAHAPIYSFHEIVQRLAEIQNDNAHWKNFFRANALPYHEIRYEDLAGDYEKTLKNFFAAIGRPELPVTPPRLRKQGDARSDEFLRAFLAEFEQRTGAAFGRGVDQTKQAISAISRPIG